MKNKFLGVISIIFILIVSTVRVNAISLAEVGDNVIEEGEYDSVRFVAGNKVINKANIDGISFIAGNEITVDGVSSYGFYAGNNISINGKVLKDLFIGGNKIIISSDAVIGRDVFVAGADVTVATNLTRDLRIGANYINVSGITIEGDAYLLGDNITLDEDTVIKGKLTYLSDAKITGLDVAKIGEVSVVNNVDVTVKKSFASTAKDIILNICAGIIVMLLLFYFLPNVKDKLDKVELKIDTILKSVCIGFLILVLIPIIFVVTVFTNVLTPFALILACIYGVSIYLGTLLSGYIIGNVLTKKVINKDNKYLALIIGIVIVRVIKLIPYIGEFIGVICFLYGMGLITSYIKSRNM